MADFNEINNTPDTTDQFDKNDIEQNKIMGILAYLSWLVLVPLLAAPNSKFAKFHANQGLVLAICEIVLGVIIGVLTFIPVVGIIAGIAGGILELVCLVLAVLGIMNAANGRAKELPVIGNIRILK